MGTHLNCIDKWMQLKMGTHDICLFNVGAHLNCINELIQLKMGTHNICLYKEVDKKYTGCNLKTMELLDYVLIGGMYGR